MKVEQCRDKCSKDCKCMGFIYKEDTSKCLTVPVLGTLIKDVNATSLSLEQQEWKRQSRRGRRSYSRNSRPHPSTYDVKLSLEQQEWKRRSRRGRRSYSRNSHPHPSTYDVNSRLGKHMRPGISVFVNFVSKRIHRSTLLEAFSIYGKVIDVYIAYNNPRRTKNSHTFAFIRFSSWEEARKAVELGNNRRIDGFYIKVNLDFKQKDCNSSGSPQVEINKRKPTLISKDAYNLTTGRSYKEVLVPKNNSPPPRCKDNNHHKAPDAPIMPNNNPNFEPFHFTIPPKDLAWLEYSLVGQVKSMYDANFVQEILRSEGFKVKVSVWSGSYVIIQFEEEEQLPIFWDLKNSMLRDWFDDIDTVDHFSDNKKQKVWVNLENVPLEVWNDVVFESIVNRWGSVIRIEEDTSNKIRLDCARILTGVRFRSDIPSSANIFVNGARYCIKVSIDEYEEERCWIDGDRQSDGRSEFQSDEINSCRFEDMVIHHKDTATCIVPKYAGIVPSQATADHVLDKANGGVNIPLSSNHCMGPSENVKTLKNESSIDRLQDVPISFKSVSPLNSSGSSEPVAPVLDRDTGLFKIWPNCFRSSRSLTPTRLRSKLNSLHSRASPKLAGAPPRSTQEMGLNQGSAFPNATLSVEPEDYPIPLKSDGNGLSSAPVSEAMTTIGIMNSQCLCISWNIRGLGKFEKRTEVRKLIHSSKASIVFLQETKLRKMEPNILKGICGRASNLRVIFSPSIDSAGGLISLWDPNFFNLEFSMIEQSFILMSGKFLANNFNCILINVYAPNDFQKRQMVFSAIKERVANKNIPVLMGGDFNTVRVKEEKVGVSLHKGAMKAFSDFIEELSLINFPLHGGHFTWSNLRDPPSCSRLDRFLLSPEIAALWPALMQLAMPKGISDHNPVSLTISCQQWGPKPFKLFDHWFDSKDMVETIKSTCGDVKGIGIMPLLRSCKVATKNWIKEHNASKQESVQAIKEKCNKLELEICNGDSDSMKIADLKRLRSMLWNSIRREEREWLQKSRLKWFQVGDKNSKFFHLVASARRRSNYIDCVKVGEASVRDPDLVKEFVKDHFQNFYNDSPTIPTAKFDCISKFLCPDSAKKLEEPFSEEEIWNAISVLDGSRAPGPDGFNLGFIKKFWPSLKDEILTFFSKVYTGEVLDFSFNHSFIVLIPKIASPCSMEDYRPISLVGCIYKVLAKVLALRLSRILEEVIGETQFAFCPSKQILDCSLISNKIIDYTKKRGLKGIVFKADFQKAYDMVDWNFLMFLLEKMGFGSVWRAWVYMCISTAKISVLINGSPTKQFSISRGLRQGCPLSPLLFNIIAEALSSLLGKANEMGFFNGLNIGSRGVNISHLQFADDLIVFSGDSETGIRNIVRILRGFEIVSGLKLNINKSKLLGINVEEHVVESWASLIHCKSEKLPTVYLGLPLGNNRNDAQIWAPIVEKVKCKLAGWKAKSLSFGGRITLVKSVLTNLPIYFMSIFPMPGHICSLLSRMIANFLWGSIDRRAIHWVSWKTICLPKSCGGLGFMDFNSKNKALLLKWIWRYATEPDNLWRKVVEARYEVFLVECVSRLLEFAAALGSLARLVLSASLKNFLQPCSCVVSLFADFLVINAEVFWLDYWSP
ncbi:hypothetical protein GQ457_01G003880 [Hibiscus cannabinus]